MLLVGLSRDLGFLAAKLKFVSLKIKQKAKFILQTLKAYTFLIHKFIIVASLPNLNYVGVALTISSLLVFVLVDSRGKQRFASSLTASAIITRDRHASGPLQNSGSHSESLLPTNNNQDFFDPDWLDSLSLRQQRALGISLSLASGALYGANFLPITLAVEKKMVGDHLDATFSHFTGILVSHLFFFLIYSVYRQVPEFFQTKVLRP